MKTTQLLIILAMAASMGCASSEERAIRKIDITTVKSEDTVNKDTITNVNGRSGDNGTGTDTTNTVEQKAIRESANN